MLIWLDDLEWSWKMLGSIWLRYWQNIMKHPSFLSSNLTWVCFHSAKYHTKNLPDHYLCCFIAIASSWPLKMSSTTTTRRWCTHGWHWRSTPWRNHTAIRSCLKVMFFRSKVNFYIFLKERIEERCLEAALFLILILDVEESSAFLVAIMLSLNDQWLMLGIGH